jgi:flagellar assembly protein FliH
MASPARFLFDTDFGAPPPPPKPLEPEVPMVEEAWARAEIAKAEARGRAIGRDEGQREGRAAAEVKAQERIAEEAGRLTAAARSILAVLDAERLRVERDALDLAVLTASRLAEVLVSREPTAEIEALLKACLAPLAKAPHLVVRLQADHVERLKPELDRLAREAGFAGRLVVLGEPDIAVGDCRIEWADGGLVRDRAAIQARVIDLIDQYMAGRAADLAAEG